MKGNRTKKYVVINRKWLDDYFFNNHWGFKYFRLAMHIAYQGNTNQHMHILFNRAEKKRLARNYGIKLHSFLNLISEMIGNNILERVGDIAIKLSPSVFTFTDLHPMEYLKKKRKLYVCRTDR